VTLTTLHVFRYAGESAEPVSTRAARNTENDQPLITHNTIQFKKSKLTKMSSHLTLQSRLLLCFLRLWLALEIRALIFWCSIRLPKYLTCESNNTNPDNESSDDVTPWGLIKTVKKLVFDPAIPATDVNFEYPAIYPPLFIDARKTYHFQHYLWRHTAVTERLPPQQRRSGDTSTYDGRWSRTLFPHLAGQTESMPKVNGTLQPRTSRRHRNYG
jgi:hypothetical protein